MLFYLFLLKHNLLYAKNIIDIKLLNDKLILKCLFFLIHSIMTVADLVLIYFVGGGGGKSSKQFTKPTKIQLVQLYYRY